MERPGGKSGETKRGGDLGRQSGQSFKRGAAIKPHLSWSAKCSSAGGCVCGRLKGVEGKESRSGWGKTVGLKFLFLHILGVLKS